MKHKAVQSLAARHRIPLGPDHLITLNRSGPTGLPAGWRMRVVVPADLAAVRRIYDRATTHAAVCGAAVRADGLERQFILGHFVLLSR